jgi:hypothetical protein
VADLTGFNAHEVDPISKEPIPAGKYLAAIIDAQRKPNKKGTGKYLELVFEVVEGPHTGRRFWVYLNLEHPSKRTVDLARGELSAICRAVGVMTPKDSLELMNIPLMIVVGLKRRDDTGELGNVINSYERRGHPPAASASATPAPASAAGSSPAASSDATPSTPPWKK